MKIIRMLLFIVIFGCIFSCSKKPPDNTVHVLLRMPHVEEKIPIKLIVDDSIYYKGVYKHQRIFNRFGDQTIGYLSKSLDSVNLNLHIGNRRDSCFGISLKSIDTLLIIDWEYKFGLFSNHDEWMWQDD